MLLYRNNNRIATQVPDATARGDIFFFKKGGKKMESFIQRKNSPATRTVTFREMKAPPPDDEEEICLCCARQL